MYAVCFGFHAGFYDAQAGFTYVEVRVPACEERQGNRDESGGDAAALVIITERRGNYRWQCFNTRRYLRCVHIQSCFFVFEYACTGRVQ